MLKKPYLYYYSNKLVCQYENPSDKSIIVIENMTENIVMNENMTENAVDKMKTVEQVETEMKKEETKRSNGLSEPRWATDQDVYDFLKEQHIKEGRTSPIPEFKDCFKNSGKKDEAGDQVDTDSTRQEDREINDMVDVNKIDFEIVNKSTNWAHIQKLDVSTSIKSSIASMRAMFAKLAIVPLGRVRFEYNRVTLLDDQTIDQYGIKPNDKVYLFIDGEQPSLDSGKIDKAVSLSSSSSDSKSETINEDKSTVAVAKDPDSCNRPTIIHVSDVSTLPSLLSLVPAASTPIIPATASATNIADFANPGAGTSTSTTTGTKTVIRISEGKMAERGYRWSIANFSKYLAREPGKYIRGSPFLMGGHTWQLKLYAGGSWGKIGSMSLFLECMSPPAKAEFTLRMVNKNDAKNVEFGLIEQFTDKDRIFGVDEMSHHTDILPESKGYVINDTAVYECQISILDDEAFERHPARLQLLKTGKDFVMDRRKTLDTIVTTATTTTSDSPSLSNRETRDKGVVRELVRGGSRAGRMGLKSMDQTSSPTQYDGDSVMAVDIVDQEMDTGICAMHVDRSIPFRTKLSKGTVLQRKNMEKKPSNLDSQIRLGIGRLSNGQVEIINHLGQSVTLEIPTTGDPLQSLHTVYSKKYHLSKHYHYAGVLFHFKHSGKRVTCTSLENLLTLFTRLPLLEASTVEFKCETLDVAKDHDHKTAKEDDAVALETAKQRSKSAGGYYNVMRKHAHILNSDQNNKVYWSMLPLRSCKCDSCKGTNNQSTLSELTRLYGQMHLTDQGQTEAKYTFRNLATNRFIADSKELLEIANPVRLELAFQHEHTNVSGNKKKLRKQMATGYSFDNRIPQNINRLFSSEARNEGFLMQAETETEYLLKRGFSKTPEGRWERKTPSSPLERRLETHGKRQTVFGSDHTSDKSGFLKLITTRIADVPLDKNGASILHGTVSKGLEMATDMLLDQKADVNLADNEGTTPLYIACSRNYVTIAEKMLLAKANPNVLDKDGFSPLFVAAQENYVDIVELLLRYKADADIRGNDGFTPLHTAAQNNFQIPARMLVEAKANINLSTTNGFSALHMACTRNHIIMAAFLLKHGANMEQENVEGSTPLYLVTCRRHTSLLEFLLDRKANVNPKTKRGFTPLQLASQEGFLDCVTLLLKYKADTEIVDEDGETALYAASYNGHTEVVRLLLDHNADLAHLTKDGVSAVDIACKQKHQDVMTMLLGYLAHDVTPIEDDTKGNGASGNVDMGSPVVAKPSLDREPPHFAVAESDFHHPETVGEFNGTNGNLLPLSTPTSDTVVPITANPDAVAWETVSIDPARVQNVERHDEKKSELDMVECAMKTDRSLRLRNAMLDHDESLNSSTGKKSSVFGDNVRMGIGRLTDPNVEIVDHLGQNTTLVINTQVDPLQALHVAYSIKYKLGPHNHYHGILFYFKDTDTRITCSHLEHYLSLFTSLPLLQVKSLADDGALSGINTTVSEVVDQDPECIRQALEVALKRSNGLGGYYHTMKRHAHVLHADENDCMYWSSFHVESCKCNFCKSVNENSMYAVLWHTFGKFHLTEQGQKEAVYGFRNMATNRFIISGQEFSTIAKPMRLELLFKRDKDVPIASSFPLSSTTSPSAFISATKNKCKKKKGKSYCNMDCVISTSLHKRRVKQQEGQDRDQDQIQRDVTNDEFSSNITTRVTTSMTLDNKFKTIMVRYTTTAVGATDVKSAVLFAVREAMNTLVKSELERTRNTKANVENQFRRLMNDFVSVHTKTSATTGRIEFILDTVGLAVGDATSIIAKALGMDDYKDFIRPAKTPSGKEDAINRRMFDAVAEVKRLEKTDDDKKCDTHLEKVDDDDAEETKRQDDDDAENKSVAHGMDAANVVSVPIQDEAKETLVPVILESETDAKKDDIASSSSSSPTLALALPSTSPLSDQDKRIDKLQQTIEDQAKQIDRLQDKNVGIMAEQSATIEQQKSLIEKLQVQQKSITAEYVEACKRQVIAKSTLVNRDKTIEEMTKAKKTLDNQLANAKAQWQAFQNKCERQKTELEQLNAKYTAVSAQHKELGRVYDESMRSTAKELGELRVKIRNLEEDSDRFNAECNRLAVFETEHPKLVEKLVQRDRQVRLLTGSEALDKVEEKELELLQTRLNASLTKITEERFKRKNALTCSVCMHHAPIICIIDCGHKILCAECAADPRIVTCPKCRKPITQKVRIYD